MNITLTDQEIDRIAARLEERLISRQVALLAPTKQQQQQPSTPPQDNLLREEEVALRLGVSLSHLRRLRQDGRFAVSRSVRPIGYSQRDIEAARAVLRLPVEDRERERPAVLRGGGSGRTSSPKPSRN